jgi:hypothetical protein
MRLHIRYVDRHELLATLVSVEDEEAREDEAGLDAGLDSDLMPQRESREWMNCSTLSVVEDMM